jgi:hypothetical protein
VGFIDTQGVIVIHPRFDWAGSFREGLAPVGLADRSVVKCGYIDKAGRFVIHPQYDTAHSFSEGLASVRTAGEAGKWGYIGR